MAILKSLAPVVEVPKSQRTDSWSGKLSERTAEIPTIPNKRRVFEKALIVERSCVYNGLRMSVTAQYDQ